MEFIGSKFNAKKSQTFTQTLVHTLNKFRLRLSCVRKYLSLDLENWWNTLSFNTTYHITMYIL